MNKKNTLSEKIRYYVRLSIWIPLCFVLWVFIVCLLPLFIIVQVSDWIFEDEPENSLEGWWNIFSAPYYFIPKKHKIVSYEDSVKLLDKGIHSTQFDGPVKISKMTNVHLVNSINYGKKLSSSYWVKAVLLFTAELAERNFGDTLIEIRNIPEI